MQPTLQLTFLELVIRVAEYLGVCSYGTSGTGVAAIPTDAHDLDVCKRLVNDGWRKFINSRSQWNWLQPEFTITTDTDGTGGQNVNSDNWRYYMPDGFFGQLIGQPTFIGTSRPYSLLDVTDPGTIESLRSISSITGIPQSVAVRPIVDDKSRWEMIMYPAPGASYNIKGFCRIYPNKLEGDDDVPNCGFQFAEAVLAAALCEAESQRDDAAGNKQSEWERAFNNAVNIDLSSAPRRLGGVRSGGRRSWYEGVDAYINMGTTIGNGTKHTF